MPQIDDNIPLDISDGTSAPQARAPGAINDDVPLEISDGGTDAPTQAHKPSGPRGPEPYAVKVARMESGNNPESPDNGDSSGVDQFEPQTWLPLIRQVKPELAAGKSDAQLLQMRHDPALSAQMTDALADQNSGYLNKHNVATTDATKYAAHWFGPAGAEALYHADPAAPISSVPEVAKYAQGNGLDRFKTVGDLQNYIAQGMGEDYFPTSMSGTDAAISGAKAFPGSVGKMAAGIYSAVTSPIKTAGVLKQIAVGIDSKINGINDPNQEPEQKEQDEAVVNYIMHSFPEKWGSVENIKNAVSHDPAPLLADVSALFGGAAGVAGRVGSLASKAGELSGVGALGDVGDGVSAVGRGLGTASTATNPLNPGGILTAGVNKIIPQTAKVVDDVGNLHPAADAILQKYGVDYESLAPEAQQSIVNVLKKKGISEPSVREAIVKAAAPDAEVPTSITTGNAPPSAAVDTVKNAVNGNNSKIASAATNLAGGDAPVPGAIAAALERAHVNAINSTSAKYDKIGQLAGSFGKALNKDVLNKNLNDQLASSGVPDLNKIGATPANLGDFPQANKAIGILQDSLLNGKYSQSATGVDGPELMRVRQSLSGLASGPPTKDTHAVGAIIDAFDKTIQDHQTAGLWKDAAGSTIDPYEEDVGGIMNDATSSYRKMKNTFESAGAKNPGNEPIKNAINGMKANYDRSGDTVGVGGDPVDHIAAQKPIEDGLLHPTKGPRVYDRLVDAMGGEDSEGAGEIRDFLNKSAMSNDGSTLTPSKNVAALLGSDGPTVMDRAMNPEKLAQAKLIHAAHGINNSKPTLRSTAHSVLGGLLGRSALRSLSAVAGFHGAGLPGAMMAEMAELGAEHAVGKMKSGIALRGAPSSGPGLIKRGVGAGMRGLLSPAGVEISNQVNQVKKRQTPFEGSVGPVNRSGHAYGGRVMDHVAEADKLIELAHGGLKRQGKRTEHMLGMHDDVVATALKLADKHI